MKPVTKEAHISSGPCLGGLGTHGLESLQMEPRRSKPPEQPGTMVNTQPGDKLRGTRQVASARIE